jgi:hypothetical protein
VTAGVGIIHAAAEHVRSNMDDYPGIQAEVFVYHTSPLRCRGRQRIDTLAIVLIDISLSF